MKVWKLIGHLASKDPGTPVKIARNGCGRPLRVLSTQLNPVSARGREKDEFRPHLFTGFATEGRTLHTALGLIRELLDLPVNEDLLIRRASCRRTLVVQGVTTAWVQNAEGPPTRQVKIWLEWEKS